MVKLLATETVHSLKYLVVFEYPALNIYFFSFEAEDPTTPFNVNKSAQNTINFPR